MLSDKIPFALSVHPGQMGRTLPACNEPFDDGVSIAIRFCCMRGVAARADERRKLERWRRYISRRVAVGNRMSLTTNGNVRYDVNGIISVVGL